MKKGSKSKFKNLFITTTDTIVGIGAPLNEENLKLLYEVKKRPIHKKIIIAVGSIDQARVFKNWNPIIENYAKKYWPGNTTLVLDDKTAFRMPNNKMLINLLLKKGPCYLTSANISGQKALNFNEAIKKFDFIEQKYDFGLGSNKPSKIIDTRNRKILRDE